jgi:hypothetical protein
MADVAAFEAALTDASVQITAGQLTDNASVLQQTLHITFNDCLEHDHLDEATAALLPLLTPTMADLIAWDCLSCVLKHNSARSFAQPQRNTARHLLSTFGLQMPAREWLLQLLNALKHSSIIPDSWLMDTLVTMATKCLQTVRLEKQAKSVDALTAVLLQRPSLLTAATMAQLHRLLIDLLRNMDETRRGVLEEDTDFQLESLATALAHVGAACIGLGCQAGSVDESYFARCVECIGSVVDSTTLLQSASVLLHEASDADNLDTDDEDDIDDNAELADGSDAAISLHQQYQAMSRAYGGAVNVPLSVSLGVDRLHPVGAAWTVASKNHDGLLPDYYCCT